VGDFTNKIRKELQTNITQNQPKMMTVNKNVVLSIDTNLERPQARRVTFSTEENNIFYLELAMDKTEFIQLEEFEIETDECPDAIIEQTNKKATKSKTNSTDTDTAAQDLLDELGI
jgi:hypothetical protein